MCSAALPRIVGVCPLCSVFSTPHHGSTRPSLSLEPVHTCALLACTVFMWLWCRACALTRICVLPAVLPHSETPLHSFFFFFKRIYGIQPWSANRAALSSTLEFIVSVGFRDGKGSAVSSSAAAGFLSYSGEMAGCWHC